MVASLLAGSNSVYFLCFHFRVSGANATSAGMMFIVARVVMNDYASWEATFLVYGAVVFAFGLLCLLIVSANERRFFF